MGVAVGTLVRNQVAGVIGALVLAFIVDPLIPRIDETAADFTPLGAANALAGNVDGDTLAMGWAGLLVAGYTAILMIAAVIAERRRDVA
jgi:ABC-2 type transport system permease protein